MKNLKKVNYIFIILSLFLYQSFQVNVFAFSNRQKPSPNQQRLSNNLNAIGVAFTQSGNNVNVIIDEQKILSSFQTLESQGIISKLDIASSYRAPLSVSVVIVGISSTITIVNNIFTHSSLKNVHVNGYIIPIGKNDKEPCYSFNYDRNKFNTLDLNVLTPRQFIITIPNLKYSEWCKATLDNEASNLNSQPVKPS